MTFRPSFQICRVLNPYVSNPANLFSSCQKNYANIPQNIFDKLQVRKYSASTKPSQTTSSLNCKQKKKTNEAAKCEKYPEKGCKPARTVCGVLNDTKCKKINAPYKSFGDVFDNMQEPDPSECVDHAIDDLQPKYMKLPKFVVLIPPPPKARQIDPGLERKCLDRGKDKKEVEWKPFDTAFINPCPHCTVPPCKPRARQSCGLLDNVPCTKKEAPYESFTDRCPQFPDLPLSECEMAEIIALKTRDELDDQENQKEHSSTATASSADSKETHVSTSTKNELKKSPKDEVKKDGGFICPKPISTKDTVNVATSQKEKEKSSSPIKLSKPICVSTKDALKNTIAPSITTTSISIKSDPIISKCKENEKLKEQITKETSACAAVESSSLWEKICAYFRARPNCPAPDDWKKEKLLRKAKRAAAAAGLELCEVDPCKKTNTITISDSTKLSNPCKTKKKSTKSGKKTSACGSKFISPSCANIKSGTSSSKGASTSKKYSTFQYDRRPYSTYGLTLTRCRHNINNSNKRMFENQIKLILDNNLLKYSKKLAEKTSDEECSNRTTPCCEDDDNYVGKIFQIRLTKSNNSLVKNGINEDMYTTCYTCKFVPKSCVVNNHNSQCKTKRNKIKRNTSRVIKITE